MITFIKNLFKNLFPEPEPINSGDIWYSVSDKENPFREKRNYIRIKGYKKGWVNYKIGLLGGRFFQDEVMEESAFREIYNKYEYGK